MTKITILPGASLRNSICDAMRNQEPASYQLQILSPSRPLIRTNSGEHTIAFSKIRVAYQKGEWIITEFTFGIDGNSPKPRRGDCELLETIEALLY